VKISKCSYVIRHFAGQAKLPQQRIGGEIEIYPQEQAYAPRAGRKHLFVAQNVGRGERQVQDRVNRSLPDARRNPVEKEVVSRIIGERLVSDKTYGTGAVPHVLPDVLRHSFRRARPHAA
jgi:hypothetical protein